jgi:hypothetical protein
MGRAQDVQEYLQGDLETSEFVQITAPTVPEALPLVQVRCVGPLVYTARGHVLQPLKRGAGRTVERTHFTTLVKTGSDSSVGRGIGGGRG